MTEDATLTDFLEDDDATGEDNALGGDDEEGDDDATGEDDAASDDVEPESADVAGSEHSPDASEDEPSLEPATPTSAWGEYTCRDCGSSVSRVWRDGEDVVCGTCKSW